MHTNKVILTDSVAQALVILLVRENLLPKPSYLKNLRMSRKTAQNVLALLVMFDSVILPDFSGEIRHTEIEDREAIQVIPQQTLPASLQGIDQVSDYEPLFEAFNEAIDLTLRFRPIVLNRVVQDLERNNLWSLLAKLLKVSKYTMCMEALDYIAATRFGRNISLDTNLVATKVPNDIRALIDKDLSGGNSPSVGHSVSLLITFLLAAQQVQSFEQLMTQLKAGVASQKYTGLNSLYQSVDAELNNWNKLTQSFHLVRHAIHQEVSHFPYIENISHAMRLRKDSNLRSYREQVIMFNKVLIEGSEDAIVAVHKDVRKAQQALQKNEVWEQRLNWVTYLSLPISIIEILAGGIPAASMPLSIFSIAKTWDIEQSKRRNSWIMFGR